MKRNIFVFAAFFVLTGLCFAQGAVLQPRVGEVNQGIFYQEGIASWYGGEFNGKPTASGEIFNDAQLTAAHPILPFGTLLRVTNKHNDKTVTVRVNDRGPFVAERIIDISRSAAELLDMTRTGTAPVIVESIHEVALPIKTAAPAQAAVTVQPAAAAQPAPEQPAFYTENVPARTQFLNQVQQPADQKLNTVTTPLWADTGAVRFQPAIPVFVTGKNYKVQVGAYKQSAYAIEAYEKLKKAGLNPSYEPFGDYCRVVVGGLKQEDLKSVADKLVIAGYREVLLREE